jgi:hypothetical protein
MKRLLLCTALIAVPALLPDMDVQASPIQRCASGGSVIYTDQACRALGAQPAPMSATLIRGLVAAERENARLGVEPGFLDANGGAATEEQENARAYLAARRGGASCARTPEQLQLLLRGAVSMGDVNVMAAAYNWAGMRSAQAKAVLTRLEGLAKSPVTSTNYYNASIGDAALATMSPAVLSSGGSAGYLQLVQSGGTQVTEFEVNKLAGCNFVSF